MRQSKLSRAEIEQAERAKDDRVRSRNNGYSKMHERDAGYALLRDYSGGTVDMFWSVPNHLKQEGVAYLSIPEGMFALKVGNKNVFFDAEEFRRSLRWI